MYLDCYMTTYIHTYIEQLKYMNLSITKILERSYYRQKR